MAYLLFDLALIIIIAAVLASIFRGFKQPLIPAYILAGLFISPTILSYINIPSGLIGILSITNKDFVLQLSEIGIAFLLFLVGMEIDISKLFKVSKVVIFGGLIEFALLFFLGYGTGLYFGISHIPSIYIGLLLGFSSTMIVIKLLSDKGKLKTLHGRIIIGLLLLQDIIAIFAMSILGNMSQLSSELLLYSILKALLIIGIATFSKNYIFPKIFAANARNQELLFLSAVAFCFGFSILVYLLGFSIAIGAFVAGLVLGNLPYHLQIISSVKPLKDFFSVLFFVSLGYQIEFTAVKTLWVILGVLIVLTIIVKPFIIHLITSICGYKNRVGFLTGASLGQVSEFSFIIVLQGLALRHISSNFLSLTIFLALITMITTSYVSKYEDKIYQLLCGVISFSAVSSSDHFENLPKEEHIDYVIIGYNSVGHQLLKTLERLGKKVLVVDINPDVIRHLINKKVFCIYGDIVNLPILAKLNLHDADAVICNVNSLKENVVLTKEARKINPDIKIIVTAYDLGDALQLYNMGADYVIIPQLLGGEFLSHLFKSDRELSTLSKKRLKHIYSIKKDLEE